MINETNVKIATTVVIALGSLAATVMGIVTWIRVDDFTADTAGWFLLALFLNQMNNNEGRKDS